MSTIDVHAPPWPALRSLAIALTDAGIDWRLGGSAMLAAIGVDVRVGDLDITVHADALDAVHDACRPWVDATSIGDAPPPWCSAWLVSLSIDGTDVDVIGGLCLRGPAGPIVVPLDPAGRLDLDGVAVPLADPAIWWWIYRAYRPAKAAALAEVVDADRRAAIERRLGPSPPPPGRATSTGDPPRKGPD